MKKTTLELTTEQKIKLQEDMGVVADELLFSLQSEINENYGFIQPDENTLIALSKTFTHS